jgi:hypothetical protein
LLERRTRSSSRPSEFVGFGVGYLLRSDRQIKRNIGTATTPLSASAVVGGSGAVSPSLSVSFAATNSAQ